MLSENSFIPLPVRFFKIKQITLQNGIFKILCNKLFFPLQSYQKVNL